MKMLNFWFVFTLTIKVILLWALLCMFLSFTKRYFNECDKYWKIESAYLYGDWFCPQAVGGDKVKLDTEE